MTAMTDLLTPDERELVEELRPIPIERTRKFLAILDRLAPKPQPLTAWVNVYPNGCWHGYSTRELADEMSTSTRIACIQVSYTPGEGLTK